MKRQAKSLQDKGKRHEVAVSEDCTHYLVTSATSGSTYRVVPVGPSSAICDCKFGRRAGLTCSHILSVFEFAAQRNGQSTSAWANLADAQRQHRPVQAVADILLTVRA